MRESILRVQKVGLADRLWKPTLGSGGFGIKSVLDEHIFFMSKFVRNLITEKNVMNFPSWLKSNQG